MVQGSSLHPSHVLFGFQEHRSICCVYSLGSCSVFCRGHFSACFLLWPTSFLVCLSPAGEGRSSPADGPLLPLMKGNAPKKPLQVRGTPLPRAGTAGAFPPAECALPAALAVSFVQGFAAVALGAACSQPE